MLTPDPFGAAGDLRREGKLAERLSTRSVRLARMILIQAIRNAMVNDLVGRNVADLAAVPTGKPGRLSKSLNPEQALAVLDTAKYEQRKWWRLGVDLFEYQSISKGGWVMPDMAGCAV